MVHELDGTVRIESRFGAGTRFELQLPISRAILRALLVEVDGELCAFPLTRVSRVVRASPRALVQDGGLRYLPIDGRNVGLIALSEQLDFGRTRYRETVSIVVFEQYGRPIGCVVDAIVGEVDLATRPLDRRLGRIADVASVALTADGEAVVVLDVDDLMRSAFDPRRRAVARAMGGEDAQTRRKRVLVVDDSISVRELERQLLAAAGFDVEVAIDGEDAWLTLQHSEFDLMVTDVDMPRLDGISLTRSVRQESRLRNLPVIIVSYRDRPEDFARGMEVRADRYLTKSDFDDDRFLAAVEDLIGAAGED
ncbi:MAG: response regulator [Ahniella sp.]|nr:response regulator [Ahniella sp.]